MAQGGQDTTPESTAGGQGNATFAARDGLCLFAQWWRPVGAPKAVVVVVHGIAEHSARYAWLAGQLVDHGYAVHTYDLRGHGQSAGPRAYVGAFDEYLDDLDHFLARVRAAEPDRPLFLLGHSMGGTIVTLYVLTRQPDVRGVILSSAALTLGTDISPVLARLAPLIGRLAPRLPTSKIDVTAISRDAAVVQRNVADPLVFHGAIPARTGAELIAATGRIGTQMEAFRLPVLILHGTADRLTNPAGSRQLAARAASADKTLKLYAGLYHETLNEPEKEQVLADIVAWLDAH